MPTTAETLPRTVLVLGGTGGIGQAVAQRFLADGCRVTVAGLGAGQLPVDLVQAARVAEIDLRDPGAVESLIDDHDRLDVLIAANGVIRRDQEFDPDVFADVLDVNVTATMRACVAARPLLAAGGGCIVTLASVRSFRGGPRVPAYTASKGAVVQLTKSLAMAWASEGIRVNAVAPGWIATEMTAGLRAESKSEAEILRRTPLGRWGQPEEVAAAISFLCSAEAAFITGAVLPVDGGYLAD